MKKLNFVFASCTFCSKHSIFRILENKTIRHIETAIRHTWRVANGLDNAAVENYNWRFWTSFCSKKTGLACSGLKTRQFFLRFAVLFSNWKLAREKKKQKTTCQPFAVVWRFVKKVAYVVISDGIRSPCQLFFPLWKKLKENLRD